MAHDDHPARLRSQLRRSCDTVQELRDIRRDAARFLLSLRIQRHDLLAGMLADRGNATLEMQPGRLRLAVRAVLSDPTKQIPPVRHERDQPGQYRGTAQVVRIKDGW